MATQNIAYRAYLKRFVPITFAYIASVALAVRFIDEEAPVTGLTYFLAALPAVGILGWIWAMGRLLVDLDDEYLRLLEIKKALIATGFLLSLMTVWGAMELFAGTAHFPSFFAFPVWCIGLAVGQLANLRSK
jgi:hypothetical protein